MQIWYGLFFHVFISTGASELEKNVQEMKRNLSVVREYSVRGYFLSFEVTGKIGKLADVYFTPSNYTRLRISNIFYTATTNNYPNNYKTIFLRWFFFWLFSGCRSNSFLLFFCPFSSPDSTMQWKSFYKIKTLLPVNNYIYWFCVIRYLFSGQKYSRIVAYP